MVNKGAFTLGVRDFSIESPKTTLVIYDLLTPTYYHEHFMLSYRSLNIKAIYHLFNIGCHLGCHLDFSFDIDLT